MAAITSGLSTLFKIFSSSLSFSEPLIVMGVLSKIFPNYFILLKALYELSVF
jgi:hypothetical protein